MSANTSTSARPRVALLLLWGAPAFLAADTLQAAFAGWRPVGTIEIVLLIALILWCASCGLCLSPALRNFLGTLRRELLMLVVLCAAGWSALEIAANHFERTLRPEKPFHTRGANLHNTFQPDPAWLPGIEGESHFTTGPDGIRAAAPPAQGQRRVLAIGGSTTECVYLDDTETWPARLSQHLPNPEAVWLGNVGISGFDLGDHLRFVEQSPLLDGMAALVVQPGINDLWRFLAKEVEVVDYSRFEAPAPPVSKASEPKVRRPLWARSRVIQLYHTSRQSPPPPEEQEGIGGREYAIRRDKRSAAEETGELPPLDEGLALYRNRIEGVIAACARRGVPVLFTTQPVVWRADLSAEAEARCWFGWLPDHRYLTLAALRSAMDQYNEVLKKTCAAHGVPCVDLSPLNGSEAYFYDDCHFTEAGAEAVARLVGPALGEVLDQKRSASKGEARGCLTGDGRVMGLRSGANYRTFQSSHRVPSSVSIDDSSPTPHP